MHTTTLILYYIILLLHYYHIMLYIYIILKIFWNKSHFKGVKSHSKGGNENSATFLRVAEISLYI